MTVEPIIGLSLALRVMTCALIGNLVPGLPLGALGKFALCVTMIVLFATNVIYRTVHYGARPRPPTEFNESLT